MTIRTESFCRKTWGRIFIQKEEHHILVHNILREIDEYEYDQYKPDELVAVYRPGEENKLVYLHKFEMDKIAIMRACLAKGIWVWCVDGFKEFDKV